MCWKLIEFIVTFSFFFNLKILWNLIFHYPGTVIDHNCVNMSPIFSIPIHFAHGKSVYSVKGVSLHVFMTLYHCVLFHNMLFSPNQLLVLFQDHEQRHLDHSAHSWAPVYNVCMMWGGSRGWGDRLCWGAGCLRFIVVKSVLLLRKGSFLVCIAHSFSLCRVLLK